METLKLSPDNRTPQRIPLNGAKRIQININEAPCKYRLTNFTQSWDYIEAISKSMIIDIDKIDSPWKPENKDYRHFYIEFVIDNQPTTIQYSILTR